MATGAALYALVLILYFAGLMGLALWFGRRRRTNRQYFLARGDLGPATLGFSYSATQMSGSSYMGAVGTERELGYNFAPGGVSSAAAAWFTYVLLGERLRRVAARIRCATIVDVLAARYGGGTRGPGGTRGRGGARGQGETGRRGGAVELAATVLMLIAFVPLITAQLKAAGNLFEVLLGMPYLPALFVFGGVVVLYTVIGGMHAVAWTDLIQGSIMIAGFAVLAPAAVGAAGGFGEMHLRYAELRPGAISFVGEMPAAWVVSSFLVWGFFQIGGAPAAVTRFLIPRSRRTLRRALVCSISFSCFIFASSTLIAIASGVLLPDLERTDLALPTLVQLLLHPVFGAVIVAAALGAMMSTIDSVLLLAGSLVVENLWRPRRGGAGAGADPGAGVRMARWATLAIGGLALALAIDPPASILFIVTISFSLMSSAFTFPLLLGMWWPRATRAGGLAAMIGGAAACVVWYWLGYLEHGVLNNWPWGLWPALFGSAVSLALLVSVSLATAPPPPQVRELFFGASGRAGP